MSVPPVVELSLCLWGESGRDWFLVIVVLGRILLFHACYVCKHGDKTDGN